MADVVLTTIDEYLLSLADGIERAQAELDRAAGPSARYAYYLPKLEFELKMTLEVRQRAATPDGSRVPVLLLLKPIDTTEKESNTTTVSTIRGSFTAVPNEAFGRGARARSTIVGQGRDKVTATVEVSDGSGAPMAGVPVHFNVDRDLSLQASAERGLRVELSPDTTFVDPVVLTDTSGKATSTLVISPGESRDAVLVMVLDAAGQTETVQYPLEGE